MTVNAYMLGDNVMLVAETTTGHRASHRGKLGKWQCSSAKIVSPGTYSSLKGAWGGDIVKALAFIGIPERQLL